MAAQADPDANVHAAAPLAVAIGQPEEVGCSHAMHVGFGV